VEEHVARRRDGVTRPRADLAKRMQLGRPGLAKETIPRRGAETHDARKVFVGFAKPHGAQECRKVGAQRSHRCVIVGAGVDGHDQKDRRARQRRSDRRMGDGHLPFRRVRR